MFSCADCEFEWRRLPAVTQRCSLFDAKLILKAFTQLVKVSLNASKIAGITTRSQVLCDLAGANEAIGRNCGCHQDASCAGVAHCLPPLAKMKPCPVLSRRRS